MTTGQLTVLCNCCTGILLVTRVSWFPSHTHNKPIPAAVLFPWVKYLFWTFYEFFPLLNFMFTFESSPRSCWKRY